MHDIKNLLRKKSAELFSNLRGNRRLQLGLLVIVLIACSEGFLRWSDHLNTRIKQLDAARAELRDLRRQSGNEAALHKTLAEVQDVRARIDGRLWRVSSEALGQAQLKDWLLSIFKKTTIPATALKIANPRTLGDDSTAAAGTYASLTEGNQTTSTAGKPAAAGLRELRATFSLLFTPASLEKLLTEIEGGDALAEIENLTISMRDRRAELTVRVLARLEPGRIENRVKPEPASEGAAKTTALPLPSVSERKSGS